MNLFDFAHHLSETPKRIGCTSQIFYDDEWEPAEHEDLYTNKEDRSFVIEGSDLYPLSPEEIIEEYFFQPMTPDFLISNDTKFTLNLNTKKLYKTASPRNQIDCVMSEEFYDYIEELFTDE